MPNLLPVTESPTVAVHLCDLRRQYHALRREIDTAIAGCLEHQQWINGPEVAVFESAVAAFLGVPHAVGVSSGTDALVLALRALALARTGREYFTRDEHIITTAFTFTATGDAILRAGATPVFLDINPETFLLDPATVAAYFAGARGKIVGILAVHLYGQLCDLGALRTVADAHGCFLLEDAAQAFGATWNAQQVGTAGDAAALSFFPSKPLGGFGDGGMVVTKHADIAVLVRQLRQHGGTNKYDVAHVGYNARLDTLQAAMLHAKLPSVRAWNDRRRAIAHGYDSTFAGIPGILPPVGASRAGHVYHQYTLRVAGGRRDAFRAHLQARGVQTMVYYPTPLHAMVLFRDRAVIPAPLMETERAASEVVSIPVDPLQTEEETAAVVAAIRSFV